MNELTMEHGGSLILGRVKTADGLETILEDASLSGDGEPAFIGRAQVRLHDGICIAPLVGRRCAFWGRLRHAEAGVFAYMDDAQWSYLDDHNLILGKVLDSLGDAIRGLKLLPETASTDELDRIGEAAHHVALALQALDVD